ncbi:MAG TPA: hypothetical protein VEA77_02105, partial [Hyphomicrobium sp.]|nr:hypothetical protein [Hyphomicrobium sp.]
ERSMPMLPDPPPHQGPPSSPVPPPTRRMPPVQRVEARPQPMAAPVPAPAAAMREAAAPAAAAATQAQAKSPETSEITTSEALADRLVALHKGGLSGTRTLLTSSADIFSLANEAAALCRGIAAKGHTVIMVDWNLNGSGIAEPLGQPAWPGFSELIEGKTRFEDVVRSLRDSDVHLIPSGRSIGITGEPLDADSINFLLDALDDVYEHIVVVSRTEPARPLFEAMQGRFDCGVTLVEDRQQKARARAEAGTFLGFEVDGIALFTLDKSGAKPETAKRAAIRPDRLARATA